MQVASRRVVQVAGVLLLLLGCLGKVGALFVTLPDPVVGGMFLAMFGESPLSSSLSEFFLFVSRPSSIDIVCQGLICSDSCVC